VATVSSPLHARAFDSLRSDPAGTGIFLDFDGTLSDIVDRPELARPRPGVTELIDLLARLYATVGIVTGRLGSQIHELLGPSRAEVFGMYGLESKGLMPPPPASVQEEVERLAESVPGAWVEHKGATLAIHYRLAQDPAEAAALVAAGLLRIAADAGMALFPGKMVVELAPVETPGKGEVIRRVARDRDLRGCLYAGDDRADLEAFAALDELRASGVTTVKVAARTPESPPELLAGADLVVDGPGGVVTVLEALSSLS
jgi:trehalose 6-phosphate phosphatase